MNNQEKKQRINKEVAVNFVVDWFLDKTSGLNNQKYSLTYYVSIGDQNCSEPGILKLYDPEEEILPSEGTIVIFEASRIHSATYSGNKDRVMVD